eukprot:TRINITY_DN1019_c0_g1_i10.p1 TRINITY_DN1019_c0_g1~~TRINITY_DN1019_c0_g1_i10.p1  ORF type:complete len:370 (+),score=41.72 TRINITY_DN1019_c0_g1_i10:613-1722(+)
MTHRHAFDALDRTLKDILSFVCDNTDNKIFGGLTVALGRDFRQILPVVYKGGREQIVDTSLINAEVWKHCHVFNLTVNMRLQQSSNNGVTNDNYVEFASWVLSIGNGTANAYSISNDGELNWVKIPEELMLKNENGENEDVMGLVQNVYNHFFEQSVEYTYLQERAILTPTNADVDKINEIIMSKMDKDKRVYLSADTITDIKDADQNALYTPEFLNSLKFSGLPNHSLELKVGVPIILLRNLNQSIGLCNGTRLIVRQTSRRVIEVEIITGSRIGERVYIPRIVMSPTDTGWPFTFKRRQFPVRVAFASTINKSQGQTLSKVGLYFPRQVFTHGQLYVAISRVTSRSRLKILSLNKENEPKGYTKNVV